jgi:hypothetical protein
MSSSTAIKLTTNDPETDREYYPSGTAIAPSRYDVTTQRVQRDRWTFFAKSEQEVQIKRAAILEDQELTYPKSSVTFVDPEPINLGRLQSAVYESIDLLDALECNDTTAITRKLIRERFDAFGEALESQGVDL